MPGGTASAIEICREFLSRSLSQGISFKAVHLFDVVKNPSLYINLSDSDTAYFINGGSPFSSPLPIRGNNQALVGIPDGEGRRPTLSITSGLETLLRSIIEVAPENSESTIILEGLNLEPRGGFNSSHKRLAEHFVAVDSGSVTMNKVNLHGIDDVEKDAIIASSGELTLQKVHVNRRQKMYDSLDNYELPDKTDRAYA